MGPLPLSMPIHIGKKIKDELHKQGISITDFAGKVNRSRNVVYDIFKRESIDTNLLNAIGKILKCDFFSMYSSQKEYLSESIKHFHVSEAGIPYGKYAEQITALQQQVESLQKEVIYLEKINKLLETKEKPKKK